MVNIHDTFDAERWAAITIERWEQKITQLRIGYDNQLIRSFTHHVVMDSGGNPSLISFAMNFYGRMIDMGVGKGVSLSSVGSKLTKRKPKKWYSPQLARELYRLAQLLATAYGKKATMLVKESIETK